MAAEVTAHRECRAARGLDEHAVVGGEAQARPYLRPNVNMAASDSGGFRAAGTSQDGHAAGWRQAAHGCGIGHDVRPQQLRSELEAPARRPEVSESVGESFRKAFGGPAQAHRCSTFGATMSAPRLFATDVIAGSRT